MKKIGIFYGSTTGTTEMVARTIAKKIGVSHVDVHDASTLTKALVEEYDVLILGTSTWGDGEVQDDWYDALKILAGMNLAGKCVALFGCGDSESYSDTFCDGMGIIYEDLKATGCRFCGSMPTDGYTFDHSKAVVNGKLVGLAIDDMGEDEKTDSQIDEWIKTLCINE